MLSGAVRRLYNYSSNGRLHHSGELSLKATEGDTSLTLDPSANARDDGNIPKLVTKSGSIFILCVTFEYFS